MTDSAASPPLTYGLSMDPDPLQADGAGVFSILASNDSDGVIACNSVALLLPLGTDASDLTEAGANIDARPPDGWDAAVNGGIVTFTPHGGSVMVMGQALVFTLAITANAQPGTPC